MPFFPGNFCHFLLVSAGSLALQGSSFWSPPPPRRFVLLVFSPILVLLVFSLILVLLVFSPILVLLVFSLILVLLVFSPSRPAGLLAVSSCWSSRAPAPLG
jgi:hypothetical protein